MSKQTDLINVTDAITVSGSNVGIGTSPATVLHIDGAEPELRIQDTDDSGEGKLSFVNNSGTECASIRGFMGTQRMVFNTNNSEAMRIDSTGNVGIGNASPSVPLDIAGTSGTESFRIGSTVGGTDLGITVTENDGVLLNAAEGATGRHMKFATGGTERMRIDSSGNLLVSKTAQSTAAVGVELRANGKITATIDGGNHTLNRTTSDGSILQFSKDNFSVGSIGNNGTGFVIDSVAGNAGGIELRSTDVLPRRNGAQFDNGNDLGDASVRWDDVYATNGTIQTSDRNEKQDIAALSDAETAVAVACKGLLRKFRWIDAVAEKGDDARIHFGIIAQDLQDAFTAEGLDAGRYAMFISSTWWETQTDVPAVEAVDEVLDEDGNVVTEAVEAKDAYTRTDTYETLEEAPEGATERTRLGVRYPELLAFIIGAM